MATLSNSELLRLIPQYNGSPELLEEFIENTEAIVRNFSEVPIDQQNIILLHIKNQITGDARHKILGHHVRNWDELVILLRNLFKSPKNENTIKTELFSLTNKNLGIEKNYLEINKLMTQYNSRINARNISTDTKTELIKEFLEDATQIFIKTLKEPTASQVLAQNLNSIYEVYEYILNRTNALATESRPKINNYYHNNNNYRNFQPRQNFQPRPPLQKYSYQNSNNYRNNNYRPPRPHFVNQTPMSTQTIQTHSGQQRRENHFLGIGPRENELT